MALEQAEQLFLAAEAVGPAARPLLTFYGLSQAGRAIAAARAESDWMFRRHGISSADGEAGSLADVNLRAERKGAFVVIAEVLGSSSIGATGAEVRLGDLWPLLPQADRFPLPGSGTLQSLPIDAQTHGGLVGSPVVTISNIPPNVTGWPDSGREAHGIKEFLRAYPTLGQGDLMASEGQQPMGFGVQNDGRVFVDMMWPNEFVHPGMTAFDLEDTVGVVYGGYARAYPDLDGEGRAIHPLTIWWAILFGLSILARYHPAQWGRIIDVNSSVEAVAVEHLLEAALSSLPELIHRCLKTI